MLFKSKRCWTSSTVLPHINAFTPKGIEVEMLDEQMRGQDVDFAKKYDLVAISAMGPQIGRAFDYPNILRRFAVWNTKNLSERMLYFWSNFICRSIVYKQRSVWNTIN